MAHWQDHQYVSAPPAPPPATTALLIPILAGLGGLIISFRMMRLPDPEQSGAAEQMVVG